MATPDPYKLNERICTCGRSAERIHCPHCGSATVYGSKKNVQRLNPISGKEEEFKRYSCRKCGKYFDDFEWQNDCHAPFWESPYKKKQENFIRTTHTIGIPPGMTEQQHKQLRALALEHAKKLDGKTESPKLPEKASVSTTEDGRKIFRIPGLGD
jgi:hypothetical protein